jgi:hypothetical protein
MANNLIEVTSRKTDRKVQFEKDLGSSIEDAVARFGEAVVFSNYHQQAVIKCQGRVRQILDKDGPIEDAIAAGENFVPGIASRTKVVKSPLKDMARKIADGEITPEELMAQLTAQVEELKAAEEI